eukprot:CAMPEP_0182865050 /NCGR_PEP_ID=MMETSP0034_2-20130328/7491_1 /TAXON_ID=156128 /ORGANISM="Nephroselmis pyriformis, Strain CCMP717" /LENGTH=68 /DNA_ID=CAMNT_0024997335 /DNA_START=156 /DNA_END=363 /DNA_ORIENTATION=+
MARQPRAAPPPPSRAALDVMHPRAAGGGDGDGPTRRGRWGLHTPTQPPQGREAAQEPLPGGTADDGCA